MRKRKAVIGLILGLIFISGCAKSVPVPGAANAFDSSSYLTLVTTDSVIQSSKADLTANKFPAAIVPNVKAALNGLIQAYNVANLAYRGYHAAAIANTVTPAQQTAVTNALNNVQTATSTLITAKAGN